jgi:imidazolonepropionase-like amidohydrolase
LGDQREIELLVEAGFSPVQAIRIATVNGAIFLSRQDQIGSIAVGSTRTSPCCGVIRRLA